MSHLQIGELLLLVGDGLFHQDTFNALFHSILLCLNHNRNEAKMFLQVWIQLCSMGLQDPRANKMG